MIVWKKTKIRRVSKERTKWKTEQLEEEDAILIVCKQARQTGKWEDMVLAEGRKYQEGNWITQLCWLETDNLNKCYQGQDWWHLREHQMYNARYSGRDWGPACKLVLHICSNGIKMKAELLQRSAGRFQERRDPMFYKNGASL